MQSLHVRRFRRRRHSAKAHVDILKKHMQIDDEVDARCAAGQESERHRDWEVEYQKALDQIKKNRRLDEK